MNYLIVTTDPVSTENAVLDYAKNYNPSDVFWIKKSTDKKEITADIITNMIDQFNLASVSPAMPCLTHSLRFAEVPKGGRCGVPPSFHRGR